LVGASLDGHYVGQLLTPTSMVIILGIPCSWGVALF